MSGEYDVPEIQGLQEGDKVVAEVMPVGAAVGVGL
jgi:hypothetical protein